MVVGATQSIVEPLSPVVTEVTTFIFCNQPIHPEDMFLDELLEHRFQGLQRVLEEDYEACEEIQLALNHTQLEQNIGAYEHLNANIASLYRRILRSELLILRSRQLFIRRLAEIIPTPNCSVWKPNSQLLANKIYSTAKEQLSKIHGDCQIA